MLIVERQDKLLAILRQRQTAQLEELARELDVSVSTVRRDLDVLEQQGLAERLHGGAVYRGPMVGGEQNGGGGEGLRDGVSSFSLTTRLREQVEQKRAIGRYAASLVQPHMTLLLDGGSTVIHAASQITARPLQVVTNSLHIANLFADDDQVELLVVGGNLYPRTGVLIGPIATGCMADLHADLFLFSVAGIYEQDAYNLHLPMSQLEQVMMRQAARSVMLMDSSKFGRKSLVRVCSLDEVDAIVTDDGVDAARWQHLGERLVVEPVGVS